MVLDARYEHFFAFLQQIFLNGSDVLNITDILVESRINGHVLGTHCKALSMLILVFDIENEGNAGGILGHHLFEKASRQVNPFNDERLVALVKGVDYFGKFFGDQRALIFIAFERSPTL